MTEKQLAALRAQALRNASGTPPDPKAIDRINRLRQSIFVEDIIVPQLGETKEMYEGFRQLYVDELNPQSLIQYTLAEQFIYDQWRLFRYRRLETGITTQAWARNNTFLRDNRKLPVRDSNNSTT